MISIVATAGFNQQSNASGVAVQQVLDSLHGYKWLLQHSNCSFCVQRMVCHTTQQCFKHKLGHMLDADGIRHVESKVEAIVSLPLPDSVKGVKGFLRIKG
jgi:hypothetical protein